MKRLKEYLSHWDLFPDEEQIRKFQKYYELLVEWNSFMNLTAITEKQEVILKHFVDSLALMHFMKLKDQTLIDLGSGAGFPGIPLKIANPGLKITLVDSLQKRVRFLDTVISELKLTGIRTVCSRVEDLAHQPEFRERFDLCTSRAVANLTTLSEYSLPFVKRDGYFVPYKSEKAEAELSDASYAIKILGGETQDVITYLLPESDLRRALILIRKDCATPNRFPRRAGIPSKDPIHR